MDNLNDKLPFEYETQPSCLGAVISRFIYLITNETDMTVESAWSNYEDAKKECQQWEKMKPQKQFMVVELPINGV
jgi:outer membrane protease